MAFHRKLDALMSLHPDVAVISECANPEAFKKKVALPSDAQVVWIGENPNKGLAVIGFNGFEVSLHTSFEPQIKFIAPVCVRGELTFDLLAVWAKNTKEEGWSAREKAPFLKAIDKYRQLLQGSNSIVAGDFNNHVRWDKPNHINNHANAIAELEVLGLTSAYHADRAVPHGQESEPTIFWRDRTKNGPSYHIDYVFVPNKWVKSMSEMSVGSYEDWCATKLSDHVPLVVEIVKTDM